MFKESNINVADIVISWTLLSSVIKLIPTVNT